MYSPDCGLADASPSKVDASHVLDLLLSGLCLAFYTIALHVLAWLTPRLQYLMPCMYLLGCCLADASPSVYIVPRKHLLGCCLADASLSKVDASHILAWLLLG